MTFLITGGAGFIGSHLAEALLGRGEEVIIVDDLSTGSVENIRHFRNKARLRCIFDTVVNRALLAEVIDESDIIFHLAAAVGVRLIIESPVRTIETNIKGTELVLEAAAKKKKPVFIASTSEVYGKSDKIPFREDTDLVFGATTKARWSYASSKVIDEFLGLAYWKEKKLPVVIGRLFNTVGPRQTGRYGMVLPTFIHQALEGLPLTIFGTGKQTRCFCHVSNAVEAMIRLVESDRAVGEVVNIGSDEEISVEQLAYLVKERANCSSPIHSIPYDDAYEPGFEDMPRRVPSLEKLERLTGFRPTIPLAQTVDEIMNYVVRKREKRELVGAHRDVRRGQARYAG